MIWDASLARMNSLRSSIKRVSTAAPLKQVLAEDFPKDCAALPISGGWGYSEPDAIIFVREQFPLPSAPDFVGLEYHIAQKIIYEELIIFRAMTDRFSGIDLTLKSQQLLSRYEHQYDRLEFAVSCWSDDHWDYLKTEWEANEFGQKVGFDLADHASKRAASKIQYMRELWFDITNVFKRNTAD